MASPSLSSPSMGCVNITDYDLQLPAWSLENLRAAAVQLKLGRPRSLAWAVLLNTLPPPNTDIVKSIKGHRNYYKDLLSRLTKDPRNVIGDDPLSQNDESVWKQHFCDNELKALILQDVVRTFPEELYFRDKNVQDVMVRILFCWARLHPNVGYRQGMHEILAPLLFELHLDRRFATTSLSDTLKFYLDDDYLEHDSYMLFSAIMKGLERFYTTGDVVPSPGGRLPTSTSVHNPNEVVRYLERVKDEYLNNLDPELAAHLHECNITMELFGIRWVRLLLGREFSRSEVPDLWGFLFSNGPALPVLHYVLTAMLIAHRQMLLEAEPGYALSVLMRPSALPVSYICALALHIQNPNKYPRPPTPPVVNNSYSNNGCKSPSTNHVNVEHEVEIQHSDSSSEGVAEGGDVARELAALALLRAHLPAAAAALSAALPRPPPHVAKPLKQIMQLAALLQCRNHALVDVETALEAAESGVENKDQELGRRHVVPVVLPHKQRNPQPPKIKQIREVPLKVFHQAECVARSENSDLPRLDPLRLRTE